MRVIMSHKSQMDFFEKVIRQYKNPFAGKVLDIGSLDINGGPHQLISPREYVGVDLAEGKNVTLISRGEKVNFEDSYFDVTMSSECFEHNPEWQQTLINMIRQTSKEGLVVFSCATFGRRKHGTSDSADKGKSAPLAVAIGQEYYSNVKGRDVKKIANKYFMPSSYFIIYDFSHRDLFFCGLNSGDIRELKKAILSNKSVTESFIKYLIRLLISPSHIVYNLKMLLRHFRN